VAAKQRDLVGQLAPFAERDDGERTAAASLPIDREVFGIGLDRCQHETRFRRRLSSDAGSARGRAATFTRFVSQALRLMRRLS
jgi:hypothetical protein